LLVSLGGFIALAGLALRLVGRLPSLGRPPGDIRIERRGLSFYFPIVACLLLSLLLTVVLNIVLGLLRK
jgi:hypothetical protein